MFRASRIINANKKLLDSMISRERQQVKFYTEVEIFTEKGKANKEQFKHWPWRRDS